MANKTIWKYAIGLDKSQVELPKGAEVLKVDPQGGHQKLQLWALVDPGTEEMETRTFLTVGTGHHVPEDPGSCLKFIGTSFMLGGSIVIHTFEVLPAS